MKRALALIIVGLLIVAAIGGAAYFHYVKKPEIIQGFVSSMQPPAPAVTAAEARTVTWTPRIPAIGTFRANQGIEVAPQVGGVIREINFNSGQPVQAGEVIVRLDDSTEQADLKSAEAELKRASLDLERQRELLQRGNTARTTYDSALAARDVAAAAVERTRALIAQKTIVAPFSGRLGLRKVDLGAYVSPGTALVTLQQSDPILVDFPVPEQYVGDVSVGQAVEISVDAFGARTFAGKVASLDARVSQETRSITVRAEVPNRERLLLPGMFANIRILSGDPVAQVVVPRTAVSYSLYGDEVYVVVPDSDAPRAGGEPQPVKVERRFVRLGDTRESEVAVMEGVSAGERVVTSGQTRLQPGMRVRVDNENALERPAERPRQ
ncbi:efflux RND transporter periplasmic adaptor subunit [Futiania mangrovi]|uniref:Efflux RND transporter periplasmic adaptor subunit n=1 Tax=Futiania mangrovi TaxID=2959716 RepID=A0A9J6P927_9PROT|nr:efflux RND transporter periplasmic adaptor subunit [Futiania mangrovii]MCP1336364.1 efflux RND transporter periplasmic adaptor subunit [Futiania mangrovii]